VTEWWQRDEGDTPLSIPRRDVVPESGLSDPRDVTSTPELVSFIPEWRPRRRVIAFVVTVLALGIIIWAIIDLFRLMSVTCPAERALGMVKVVGVAVRVGASGIAVFTTWRWANQRDPRDVVAREV